MIERDTGIEPVLRVGNGAIHSKKNLAPNLSIDETYQQRRNSGGIQMAATDDSQASY